MILTRETRQNSTNLNRKSKRKGVALLAYFLEKNPRSDFRQICTYDLLWITFSRTDKCSHLHYRYCLRFLGVAEPKRVTFLDTEPERETCIGTNTAATHAPPQRRCLMSGSSTGPPHATPPPLDGQLDESAESLQAVRQWRDERSHRHITRRLEQRALQGYLAHKKPPPPRTLQ